MKRDGKVSRIEYFENGTVCRTEEDTNGDAKMDKWETYEGSRLASVAFDTRHTGTPDRRLVYRADGTVSLEVANPDGQFVPVPQPRR